MLRSFFTILSLLIFSIISSNQSYAHDIENFRILYNGEEGTKLDFQQSIPNKDFLITEERSPQIYIIGNDLTLSLEPLGGFIIKNVAWDTGELAGKQTGQSITLALNEPGSYPVNLEIEGHNEKFSHSTLINISNNDYKQPQVKIFVNDKEVKKDSPLSVDLTQELSFKAETEEGSGERYIWNFDNGEIKEGQNIVYKFSENPYLVSPILRIIDKEGIYTDVQFELKNSSFGEMSKSANKNYAPVLVIVGIILGIFIAALWAAKRFLKNRF